MHAFNKSTDILKLEATQFTCICWQNTGLWVDVNPQTPFEGSGKRRGGGGDLNLLEVRVATLSGGALVGRCHPCSEDVHIGELLFLRHKREPLHFRNTVGNTNNIPLFSTVAFKKRFKKKFWYNRKRNLDTVTSTLRTAVSFILFQDFNLLRW